MKHAFVVIVLVLCLGFVYSQETCAQLYNDCGSCTADRNCGWCGPVQKCLNGTGTGPNTPDVCYGTSWFYNFGAVPNICPNCSSFDDCKSCLYWGSDCAWCSSTSKCKEWGSTLGCGPVDVCPCKVYDACSDCVKDPQCLWCGGANATCVNRGAQCAMPAHTCPCTDNEDCRSCLQDDAQGCVWCESTLGGSCKDNSEAGDCAIAFNCNAFCAVTGTSCGICNELTGCGWCDATSSCVDSAVASACPGPLQHTCPNCAAHHYCDPCLDEGCLWCESGECREKSNIGGCLIQHTCNSYCGNFKSCGICTEVQGCGWCEESGSCVDADQSTCFFAHSCADEKCHFDGGAFVGGMFLGIGLCAIGLGGYLFYKWRMAKKPGYSELH